MGVYKKISLTAASFGAALCVAGAASAADIWSGPYAGLSLGAGITSQTWQASSVGLNNSAGVDPSTGSTSLNQSYARFGGHAGYNFPINNVLVGGVEGDILANTGGKTTKTGIPGVSYFGASAADSISSEVQLDASLRGRLGVKMTPATLIYGTAGLAIQQAKFSGNCPGNSAASWCGVPESGSQTKTLFGYTIGLGAEYAVSDSVSVRLDYRFADFGTTNVNLFGGNNFGADGVASKVNLTTNLITLGVTFHFGAL